MKPPLILLMVGAVLLVLCGLATLITLVLMATSNGRISGEEAGPFIGLECCCSFVSLALTAAGGIWLFLASQKKP